VNWTTTNVNHPRARWPQNVLIWSMDFIANAHLIVRIHSNILIQIFCLFKVTGANCEKRIEPDYDLHFLESANQPARAGLGIPFHFMSNSFTLSIWVRFEGQKMVGESTKLPPTFFTLYNSRQIFLIKY
jgi:hypothetical protein